jgi:hypothetical protein
MSPPQIGFLTVAWGLILVWIVLTFIGPRKVNAPDVLHVLRYGVMLRTLALMLALMPPLIMTYVIATFPLPSTRALYGAGFSFVAVCLLGGALLIEVMRGQVWISEAKVTRISPWTRQPIEIAWTEVERIGYSSVNSWFLVRGAGKTARVSTYLVGVSEFVRAARRKLAPERYGAAASAFDSVCAPDTK